MPIYEFKHKKTGQIHEELFSYKDREKYLKDHPEMEGVLNGGHFGDPIRMGIKKPDQSWRDYLKAVKKANPGSKINTFD